MSLHIDALEFLYQRINYERRPADGESFRLRRMVGLLEALGNPHNGLQLIHVAGTKGKGSTSQMIAAMLIASGLRTGLYTSPHLRSIEERWQIDGLPATSPQLLELVERVRPVVTELDRDPVTAPTFFELTTALAFLHFQLQKVDWGVIEVGLGGRLDSTNVISPQLSVITSIGLDHQALLGHCVELIAAEKAGIIKRGIPVVSGVTTPGADEVIAQRAEQQQAELIAIGRDFDVRVRSPHTAWRTRFDYQSRSGRWHHFLDLSLVGQHQAQNAGVALAAIETLSLAKKINTPWKTRRQALSKVQCPGRLQWFPGAPPIILDVAHNIDSIKALVQTLNDHLPDSPITCVFACSADKDAEEMLECLAPQVQHLVLTRFTNNPRQRPPSELATYDCLKAASVTLRETPLQAVEEACNLADPKGVVVICGSFFLAAELLPWLDQRGRDQT